MDRRRIVLMLLIISFCIFASKTIKADGFYRENRENQIYSGIWGISNSDIFSVGDSGAIRHFDGTIWGNMSSGTTNNLRDIWGSSSADVFAVGDAGTIIHYDGSKWNPMDSGTTNNLNGIWGSTNSNIFVVGDSGIVLHYDGMDWVNVGSGTNADLAGIWGVSENNVFVAGESGTILHYDGSYWISMDSGSTRDLYGISGNSESYIVAVGDYTTLFYDGVSWGPITHGSNVYFKDVWISTDLQIFIVGAFGNYGTFLHFDGTAWSNVEIVAGNNLYAVWGDSTSDIFAVGAYGENQRWDGDEWWAAPSFLYTDLHDVWGSSSSNIYAVGNYGTILHYDRVNSTWKFMDTDTSSSFWGIWGTSESDIFAVGTSGTILHYDGTKWEPMNSQTSENLRGIWGVSGTDVYAVGDFGTILNFDGENWNPVNSGTEGDLYGVWGTSESDIFVVGSDSPVSYGAILHFDGTTWSLLNRLNPDEPYLPSERFNRRWGIWGSSEVDVYAVGGGILHFDGTRWDYYDSGLHGSYRDIWGSSYSDIFAVAFREIHHFDGNTWSVIPTNAGYQLLGIWGSSSSNIFVVGQRGQIFHYPDRLFYQTGSMVVLHPNGGDIIPAGSTYTINWQDSTTAVRFALYYSTNKGVKWNLIEEGITDTTYDWRVPTPKKNLEKCMVKIVGYNSSGKKVSADKSDSLFSIRVLRLSAPNGGELLASGSSYDIRWDTNGTQKPVDHIKIFWCSKKGAKWKLLATELGNPGLSTCVLPITAKNMTKCLVKTVAYDDTGKQVATDQSDGPFAIEVLRVLTPNGGETFGAGDIVSIDWVTHQTQQAVAKVVLKYTMNGGKKWKPIETITGDNPGTYLFTVPEVTKTKTKCKVMVKLYDQNGKKLGSDASNSYFGIEP